MAEVIRGRLIDLGPAVAETLKPPDNGSLDALGVGPEEVQQFALTTLQRRLKIIGISL
jgi:hypothetical protein